MERIKRLMYEGDEVISVKEFGEFLGISQNGASQIVHRKAIPFIKVSGHYYVRVQDALHYKAHRLQSRVATVDERELAFA